MTEQKTLNPRTRLILGVVAINLVVLFLFVPGLRRGTVWFVGKVASAFMSEDEAEAGWFYVCPMHLDYRRKQIGECGICGMSLVKKKASELTADEGVDFHLTDQHVQLAGITIDRVVKMNLTRTVRTAGQIAYDERKIKFATAWVPGRIEAIHADFTGVQVRKGDPLVDLYSPKLITTQQNYLNAVNILKKYTRSHPGYTAQKQIVDATRTRLLRWGVTEDQLRGIEVDQRITEFVTIYAPISGTVVKKDAFPGNSVKEGSNLYQIVPLDTVWLYADIYEYEIPMVRIGLPVRASVRAYPDHTFRGTVSFIDPFLNPKTRTARLRCVFENGDGLLKPGMYAQASIDVQLGETLIVPADSVMRTGELDYVFVEKGGGTFEPRVVTIGPLAGNVYPLRKGLEENEKVVRNGAFLLSSESHFRGALKKLKEGLKITLPGLEPGGKRPRVATARCIWDGMEMPLEAFQAKLEINGQAHLLCTPGEVKAYENNPNVAYFSVKDKYMEAISKSLTFYQGIRKTLAGDKTDDVSTLARALAKWAKTANDQVPDSLFNPDPRDSMRSRALAVSRAADSVAVETDMEGMRKAFSNLSMAMMAIYNEEGIPQSLKLTAYRCPMAKASWVQEAGSDMANPYYGASMLKCGSAIPIGKDQ